MPQTRIRPWDKLYESRTVLGAMTTLKRDYLILADASGGSFTITLIAAASFTNRYLIIKKIAGTPAQQVTIDAAGAETIDGALSKTLQFNFSSLSLYSDGTQWWIV